MNVGMWVASMPACAGLINKHAFPFVSVFSKIGNRIARFGSKFSLPQYSKNSSGPKESSPPSQTAEVNIRNNRPTRYVELKDGQAESTENSYTR